MLTDFGLLWKKEEKELELTKKCSKAKVIGKSVFLD